MSVYPFHLPVLFNSTSVSLPLSLSLSLSLSPSPSLSLPLPPSLSYTTRLYAPIQVHTIYGVHLHVGRTPFAHGTSYAAFCTRHFLHRYKSHGYSINARYHVPRVPGVSVKPWLLVFLPSETTAFAVNGTRRKVIMKCGEVITVLPRAKVAFSRDSVVTVAFSLSFWIVCHQRRVVRQLENTFT